MGYCFLQVAAELAEAGAAEGAVAEQAAEGGGAEAGEVVGGEGGEFRRGVEVGNRSVADGAVQGAYALANVATGNGVEPAGQVAAMFDAEVAFAAAGIHSATVAVQT